MVCQEEKSSIRMIWVPQRFDDGPRAIFRPFKDWERRIDTAPA